MHFPFGFIKAFDSKELINTLKQPSHGKLKMANWCWQTQVAVYERRKNSQQTRSIYRQQFADMFAD